MTVDKDCLASDFCHLPPGRGEIYFKADEPIILKFISENYWRSFEYSYLNIGRRSENTSMTSLNLVSKSLITVSVFSICDGDYPLPETLSITKNGVTFTFTPIPVYE